MMHPLAAFREKSGLSRAQIAKLANTTRQTIHRIESGDQTPSLKMVGRFVDVSGGELRADDFLPAKEGVSQ